MFKASCIEGSNHARLKYVLSFEQAMRRAF